MKAIFKNQYAVFALSFLCVLVAYWLYAGIVVPMMFARDPDFGGKIEDYDADQVEESEWKQYVNLVFEEGDWERECKYSIWKDDYIILFNEYKPQGNHTELKPCTVLFLTSAQKPEDEEDPEYLQQLFKESVILKSSKGAVLEFDAPFSPISANKAKFVRGRLTGNVSIHSDMKNPGPEDDLEILSGEVVFNEEQIQASSDVRFKFGKNHGSGRQFYMFLEPSDPKNSKSAKTISVMELHQVSKVYVYTPIRQGKNSEPAVDEEQQFDEFEISCKEKIEFRPYPDSDMYWIGRFNTDVDIVRVNTGYDRLTCSRLSVIFSPEPKPGQTPKKNNDLNSLPQLAPLKMYAEGKARIRSPSNNDFLAEGERIEYDFEKNRIILDCGNDPQKTVLLSMFGGRQKAEGRQISYSLGQNGRFGELIVPGGGVIQGLMSPQAKEAKDQRRFQLKWTDKLQAGPDSEDPTQVRCELFGQMEMHLENLGSITAKETVFWFNQRGDESGEPSVLPFSRSRLKKTASNMPFHYWTAGVSPASWTGKLAGETSALPGILPVRWTTGKPAAPQSSRYATPRVAFRAEEPTEVQPAPSTISLSPTLLPGLQTPKKDSAEATLSVPVPSVNTESFSLPETVSANPLPAPQKVPTSVPVNTSLGSSTPPRQKEENALAKGFSALVPDRARLRKDVKFITENGVCNVRELDIWFYEDDGNFSSYNSTFSNSLNFADPPTTSNGDALQNANPAKAEINPPQTVAANKTETNRSFFGQQQSEDPSQMQIDGDVMQILVKMQGKAMEIEKLHLNGVVSETDPKKSKLITLREINPKQPDSPIQAEGVELRAWNPSSNRSIVQILGTPVHPARFAGMESSMLGLNVIVNLQTNYFSIEGPGEITTKQIAMSKKSMSSSSGSLGSQASSLPSAGKMPADPGPPQKKLLVVRWLGRMNFDGTRITFEKDVRAVYPLQRLNCNVLNLDLDRRVSFLQQKWDQDPDVKMLECLGKVYFEYQEVQDETQSESLLKSVLKGENFEHVRIFPESGRFVGTAFGMEQGRLKATFLDDGKGFGFENPPDEQQQPKTGLSRVDIRFYDTITGNFKNFEASASGQVACIYASVPAWNTEIDIDDREKLKAIDGYRLDCDTLEVAKAMDPLSLREGVELTASGATRIEGKQLFARGDSVKFNQLKETVILQGRGPIKAEVHIQRGPDGDFEEPILTQQIEYNLRTKKVNIIGANGSFFK